ncbi:MAG: undecaprenyl-diphosphate phosphatase, partial [Proteobacteria bacterium]|nr:undecaprenyl-diphosphate phosphatase [Pseudomonadota bacterium]
MSDSCGGLDLGFLDLDYARVAALGVIQGITELLPISSTAHMRVVPALLGWPDPGAAFSAAMQAAALVAVLSYFWRDFSQVCFGSVRALATGRFGDRDLRLGLLIVLATIPLGIAGLALAPVLNACHSPLRSLPAVGVACLVMAALLALAELMARHRRDTDQATVKDAILVGLAQVGALIPGVSRSGSTLTAALALGFKREEAARFSFLLGAPAIALAGGKEFWELSKAHLSAHGWSLLGVGLAVAAVSSFVAIWGLMRFLER